MWPERAAEGGCACCPPATLVGSHTQATVYPALVGPRSKTSSRALAAALGSASPSSTCYSFWSAFAGGSLSRLLSHPLRVNLSKYLEDSNSDMGAADI